MDTNRSRRIVELAGVAAALGDPDPGQFLNTYLATARRAHTAAQRLPA